MGLAILPPRLVPELGAVREHLLAAKADASYDLAGALEGDDLCRSHAAWAEDVFARRADELTADNAIDIPCLLLSNACLHVVKRTDCGFGVSERTRVSAWRDSKKNTHGQLTRLLPSWT